MASASKIWVALAAAGMVAGVSGTAHAVASYGDLATPPGYYAGNGPTNGNFTIDTSNGIEVGLRAKNRFTVTSIDGSSGIYQAEPGFCIGGFCGAPPKARWNYEFSVNTSGTGLDLSNYRVQLVIDTDPTAGTNFVTILDAYSNWGDNEYVDGAAPKRVDTGLGPQGGEDGVQQSANPLFGNSGFMPGFDVNATGQYDIELSVFNLAGDLLAQTDITVQVPEPISTLLLGIGLAGLGLSTRRRKVA